MEQTTNYQLSQWEAQDRILREDFNADNFKIEQALTAEANARTEADATEANARIAADAALTATLAEKGNCKMAYGTYTGKGTYGSSNKNSLTFPFEPKLVVVQSQYQTLSNIPNANYGGTLVALRPLSVFDFDSGNYPVNLIWEGKTLKWWQATAAPAQLNEKNQVYSYLAIG